MISHDLTTVKLKLYSPFNSTTNLVKNCNIYNEMHYYYYPLSFYFKKESVYDVCYSYYNMIPVAIAIVTIVVVAAVVAATATARKDEFAPELSSKS